MTDRNSCNVWLIVLASLFATSIRAEERQRPPLLSPFSAEKASQRQQEWARHLNSEVEVTNSIGIKLRLIPKGEFKMGAPESDKGAHHGEHPQHRVWITKPFYLGKYEVTRGEFRKFVAATSYKTDAEKDGIGARFYTGRKGDEFDQRTEFTWLNPGYEQTDEHPVVSVSWNDAVAFCQWLSLKEGHSYRLPTEAEWEWSCRAGTIERWSSGDTEEALRGHANIADTSLQRKYETVTWAMNWDDGSPFTSAVGNSKANNFELHDMQGNVWEWCSDWYDEKYYAKSPLRDPKGPEKASFHVFRGGSWRISPAGCRSANRGKRWPTDRISDLGFRLARDANGAESSH